MNDYEKRVLKKKLLDQGIIINKMIKLGLQLDKDIFNWSIKEVEKKLGEVYNAEEVNLNMAKIEQLKILMKLVDSYDKIMSCEKEVLKTKIFY